MQTPRVERQVSKRCGVRWERRALVDIEAATAICEAESQSRELRRESRRQHTECGEHMAFDPLGLPLSYFSMISPRASLPKLVPVAFAMSSAAFVILLVDGSFADGRHCNSAKIVYLYLAFFTSPDLSDHYVFRKAYM